MIIKSKIVRDTALLTAMQLFLDTAALMLNVFITERLGASAIGILSLMGSFLGLAGILSNGNAFLCTSRLISEELGKPCGDPNGILCHGIKLCLLLSAAVSAAIYFFAEPISMRFFSGAGTVSALRQMPAALVTGALGACFKGYFNASRRASVIAAADIGGFLVKCGVIVGATLMGGSMTEDVCGILTGGVTAGNTAEALILGAAYMRIRKKSSGKCSLCFMKYAAFSFPIMGGSILTAVLSSTNDALIPICLRQYGHSTEAALGSFGMFEGIVLPTLFFPSVALCSVSGIIVSETARARAAGESERIRRLTERIKGTTLIFSVFAAAVLIRFGEPVGVLLGGGDTAGKMIRSIAPVIPFIYMEIVLETIIKGMGMQSFSSFNYLAEYIIRIGTVLILVPRMGFWGIAVSYYASNIFGNTSRFIMVIRNTGARAALFGTVLLPVPVAFVTSWAGELARFTGAEEGKVPFMLIYTVLWGVTYLAAFSALGKIKLIRKWGVDLFVDNAQQTVSRVL